MTAMAARIRRLAMAWLLTCAPGLPTAQAGFLSFLDDPPASNTRVAAAQAKAPAGHCDAMLGSNCDASQSTYFNELVKSLKLFGLDFARNVPTENAPALAVLPKDQFGGVSWTAAVAAGLIRPKDAIRDDAPLKGSTNAERQAALRLELGEHFEKLIVIQSKNHFMADVLFPHGLHTYWLACASCHPDPYKPQMGANPTTMRAILNGQYCGKCHGKVSFPFEPFENCRRCHLVSKRVINDGLTSPPVQ